MYWFKYKGKTVRFSTNNERKFPQRFNYPNLCSVSQNCVACEGPSILVLYPYHYKTTPPPICHSRPGIFSASLYSHSSTCSTLPSPSSLQFIAEVARQESFLILIENFFIITCSFYQREIRWVFLRTLLVGFRIQTRRERRSPYSVRGISGECVLPDRLSRPFAGRSILDSWLYR